MFEIKMTIEIPGLPEALTALAGAIGKQPDFVCHQYGGNNHHVDNAGTVNIKMNAEPASAAPASQSVATPSAPVQPTVNPMTPVQPAPTTDTAALTHVPETVQVNAPTTAVPTAPVIPAESYTLEALSRAGAALIDAGKMPQLLALLGKYNVQAVTQLPKDAYSAFAAELKALGAQL